METHRIKGQSRKSPLSSRAQEQILQPHLDCREMGRTINHKVHLQQSSKTKITGGNENKRIKASTQNSEIKVKVEAGSFKKHISNNQARKDKYEMLPPVVETERLV